MLHHPLNQSFLIQHPVLKTQGRKRDLGPGGKKLNAHLTLSPKASTTHTPQPSPHPCGLALCRNEDSSKGVREPTVICCQHTSGLVQVSPELEVAEVWGWGKEGAMFAQGITGVHDLDPTDPQAEHSPTLWAYWCPPPPGPQHSPSRCRL